MLLLLLMGVTTTAEVSVSFFTAEDSLQRGKIGAIFLVFVPTYGTGRVYVRMPCNQVFKRRLKESILPAYEVCGGPIR